MSDVPRINVFSLPGSGQVVIDYQNYHESEIRIINPFLESLNILPVGVWYYIERDSFGPLIRGVAVVFPNGLEGEVFYG
jgi:hypothetical protein